MDNGTHSLFKRVAGKLGWIGPGGLDSAEKEVRGSMGMCLLLSLDCLYITSTTSFNVNGEKQVL